MLRRQLPEPLQAVDQASTPSTTVFHARTRDEYHYPTHRTPYLLICNFGSYGNYVLNRERIQANEQLFYFTNPGDELEICFEGRQSRETLLVSFDKDMVCEAVDEWKRSPEYLLEHPFGDAQERIVMPSVPFAYTAEFRNSLRNFCDSGGEMRNQILSQFLSLCSEAHRIIRRVPAEKAITRKEIYKRLAVARAFMEANLEAELTIEQIAREALLNRFYFLTTFKTTFGVTPHEYLRQRKLDRAYELLRLGHSVTETYQTVGYQSLGSFTNLFKKTFGCVPSKVNEDRKR